VAEQLGSVLVTQRVRRRFASKGPFSTPQAVPVKCACGMVGEVGQDERGCYALHNLPVCELFAKAPDLAGYLPHVEPVTV